MELLLCGNILNRRKKVKFISLALLAAILTGCNIHMCWHLDIEPEHCSKKAEEGFKIACTVSDNEMGVDSTDTWDLIDIPFEEAYI